MPDGVSYEGVFGETEREESLVAQAREAAGDWKAAQRARPLTPRLGSPAEPASGVALGAGRGAVAGVVGGLPGLLAPPPPPLPSAASTAPPGTAGPRALRRVFDTVADSRAGTYRTDAAAALGRARASADAKDWTAARRQAQLAWVQADVHLGRQPWQDDGTRAAAADLAATADAALRERAVVALPALRRRLDFTIRNAGLAAALERVAAAAGFALTLAPGALDDAAALSGLPPRVAWLDLRRATAAEALSWLVHPVGLEWTVAGGAVRVRSPRAADAPSLWSVVGAQAAAPADAAKRRARATALLAARLDSFAWSLLASALHGTVDDEAAAEMVEAARDPDVRKLVAERAPAVLLRAMWAVAQARAVSPDDATLRALSAHLGAAAGPVLSAPALPATTGYLALLGALPADLRPMGVRPAHRADVRAALEPLAPGAVADGDAALLAAIRARLAGRDAWNAERDGRTARLRGAAVGAGALRVLSRLERARLAGL
jgi:hypothetical protein